MKISRVLSRAYAAPHEMGAVIAFYERLFDERCAIRLALPALGLEIATVGPIHLIAGTEERLKPFRAATSTFWVDSVRDAKSELTRLGAKILLGPEGGPGGSFMVAQHPDGLTIEYLDQAG